MSHPTAIPLYERFFRSAAGIKVDKNDLRRFREFAKLDEADEVRELLSQAMRRPPAEVSFSESAGRLLVELFGGLSIALARSFTVIDPTVKNPSTEHWDRAFVFRMLL